MVVPVSTCWKVGGLNKEIMTTTSTDAWEKATPPALAPKLYDSLSPCMSLVPPEQLPQHWNWGRVNPSLRKSVHGCDSFKRNVCTFQLQLLYPLSHSAHMGLGSLASLPPVLFQGDFLFLSLVELLFIRPHTTLLAVGSMASSQFGVVARGDIQSLYPLHHLVDFFIWFLS